MTHIARGPLLPATLADGSPARSLWVNIKDLWYQIIRAQLTTRKTSPTHSIKVRYGMFPR